nr:larval cuticle protein 65Ab1-like [Plodia interpunctella]
MFNKNFIKMDYPRTVIYLVTMLLLPEFLNAYKLYISNIHKGEYSYSYDTDDGTIMENREGKIDENGDQVVTGSYTFLVDDSQYTVTYTADKNGYHPKITITKFQVPALGLPSTAVASLLG